MEYKKKLVIKVLTKLKPYRNLAEGFLALVESIYIDEKSMDAIIQSIAQSIKSVKKESEKLALQKWLEKIKKIRSMGMNENASDQELDKLLADI